MFVTPTAEATDDEDPLVPPIDDFQCVGGN